VEVAGGRRGEADADGHAVERRASARRPLRAG
jgi:hypothetical protein